MILDLIELAILVVILCYMFSNRLEIKRVANNLERLVGEVDLKNKMNNAEKNSSTQKAIRVTEENIQATENLIEATNENTEARIFNTKGF